MKKRVKREGKKMEYKMTNEEAAAYVELQEMLANEERRREQVRNERSGVVHRNAIRITDPYYLTS